MSIETDTRVALVGIPTQTGRVQGTVINGYAYVRWDGGGGNNVHVDRLVPTERNDHASV